MARVMAAKRFTIFFFVVLFLSIPIYLNDIIVRSTSSSELCFSFFLLAFFQKHAPTQTQGGTHTDWVCFTLEHNTFMFERVFVAVRHWRWREKKKSDHTFIWLNCQNGGQKKKKLFALRERRDIQIVSEFFLGRTIRIELFDSDD